MLDQDMADLRGIERTTVATVVVSWRAANGCGEDDYRVLFWVLWVSVSIVRGFKRHLDGHLNP
ncbi:hypothetical protein D3C86_1736240 [compost metagenome]